MIKKFKRQASPQGPWKEQFCLFRLTQKLVFSRKHDPAATLRILGGDGGDQGFWWKSRTEHKPQKNRDLSGSSAGSGTLKYMIRVEIPRFYSSGRFTRQKRY